MSLLGIDVGTTGCKAGVFSTDGRQLAYAYEEYDVQRPQAGWAELDACQVWEQVKRTARRAVAGCPSDPVTALAVSSLGEAMVPVSASRQVLGPSILNFDVRGQAYLGALNQALDAERLYRINGNTLGNHFGLTKLLWIRDHQPELYRQTAKFLNWSSFVAYMLGAEPVVDYSLANRSLLFDLAAETWSDELLDITGLERDKLPETSPSGKVVGKVSAQVAAELGLPAGVSIVTGAHDQCANAVGCGVIQPGQAVYGMGTYICITPVFNTPREPGYMLARGLNTEHHAVPGTLVSFIYNQGGALVKWYRDTFAAMERDQARQSGHDIYTDLIAEMPGGPAKVLALPHFTTTGPPHFISDSSGVLLGLHLETTRGEILKGLIEGSTFYLKECVEALPETGIQVNDFRAVGGGSRSDAWIQACADIMDRPFVRPVITEAGALGAAIIAGVGQGVYANYTEGVATMVHLERTFEPDPQSRQLYQARYEKYTLLCPLMQAYLQELNPQE